MNSNKSLIAGIILVIGLAILIIGFNQNTTNQRMNPYQQLPESRLESRVENNPETSDTKFERLDTQTILPPIDQDSGAVETGDRIVVNYRGWLASNGEVFDESFKRNEPFTFTVGSGVIEGWSQGVLGMKVGEVRRLKIPANLGYGEQAVGSIPANSDLIFDVELLQIM